MSILRAFTLLMLVLGAMTALPAQEISLDTKITFSAPPEVEIKLRKSSKSSKVRGVLTSLSKLEAVVANEKGEQRVSFDRIESLKTALVEFTGDDDYLEIGKKVRAAYSSVEISGMAQSPEAAGAHRAPATSPEANAVKPVAKPEPPMKPSLGQGGFGGIKNVAKPKTEQSGTASETASSEAEVPSGQAPGPSEDMSLDATEVYICDNCKKEITGAHLKAGQCPHCKIDFAVAVTAPRPGPAANPFGAPKPAPGNVNPFGAATGGQGGVAPQGGPVPAPPAPAVIQGGSSGFTLESIPNWAKGGLFVLLVLVGYHVVFNR